MQTHFSLVALADPDTAEAEHILRACVHCGFCTATCPTYLLEGDELDSPRGRIYLIKDMLEGGKDGIIIVWSWLYGYYSADDAEPVLDFQVLTDKGKKLAEACQANPSKDVISVAKPIYE